MSIPFRLLLSRIMILVGILWTLVVFANACGDTNTAFSILQAALAGVGIVVTGLGALISPGEATLINGTIATISALVTTAQTAWDTYESDPSAAGALAALQAASTNFQAQIPNLLSGLNITNPTLKAWITTLVGLVGKLASAIAVDITPKLTAAHQAHVAGNDEPMKALHAKFKESIKAFVVAHNAALDASGLPPAVIKAVHDKFKHATGSYIGPIHI